LDLEDLTDGEREVIALALTIKTADEVRAMAKLAMDRQGPYLAQKSATGLAEGYLAEGKHAEAAAWSAVGLVIRDMVKRRPLN